VLRIDLRAYGRSGGDCASFGGREADDVRAWIDVLSSRVGPTLRVAVWGRSMGAAIAGRAAAGDARIAAIVLESPYADLQTIVAGWLRRYRLPATGVLARLILARAGKLAGVSLARPRPIDLAPEISAATLLVHGTSDTLVPAGDARRLAAAFPHALPLVEVAGAGHGNVLEIGGPDLLTRIGEFLEGAVREREPVDDV
jgi:pimeloyl-ACP methyl ester carboxylesterase